MDAYLCLLHLTAAFVLEPVFNTLAIAAFFQFVLFAIFEMRLVLMVWRAQGSGGNSSGVHGTWWLNFVTGLGSRRELSMLYLRFYGVLLAGEFGFHHCTV